MVRMRHRQASTRKRNRDYSPAFQRIGRILIKVLDFAAPEPRLLDLKVTAKQSGRRHFLNSKANGFRGSLEALVFNSAASVLGATRKQFRWRAVIQLICVHLI